MQQPTSINTLGYMLAGGRATRMGGVNKAGVHYAGEPMGWWVMQSLQAQCAQVWVSANRDASLFYRWGAKRVIADLDQSFAGPLAALEALEQVWPETMDWVLVSPCDVPKLPASLLSLLSEVWCEFPESRILTVKAGSHTHNTIALLHRSTLPSIAAYLSEGNHKVGLWMEQFPTKVVLWTGEDHAFDNYNALDEIPLSVASV